MASYPRKLETHWRPRFTLIQNRRNYCSVYFNLHIFG